MQVRLHGVLASSAHTIIERLQFSIVAEVWVMAGMARVARSFAHGLASALQDHSVELWWTYALRQV